jgi:hypothetical protein
LAGTEIFGVKKKVEVTELADPEKAEDRVTVLTSMEAL